MMKNSLLSCFLCVGERMPLVALFENTYEMEEVQSWSEDRIKIHRDLGFSLTFFGFMWHLIDVN